MPGRNVRVNLGSQVAMIGGARQQHGRIVGISIPPTKAIEAGLKGACSGRGSSPRLRYDSGSLTPAHLKAAAAHL